jgi:hypothetical protein
MTQGTRNTRGGLEGSLCHDGGRHMPRGHNRSAAVGNIAPVTEDDGRHDAEDNHHLDHHPREETAQRCH